MLLMLFDTVQVFDDVDDLRYRSPMNLMLFGTVKTSVAFNAFDAFVTKICFKSKSTAFML